jgi:predicted GIY-YIG superfamily endonuclease
MNSDHYFIYVLELSNGLKYVGQANNLERRLAGHRSGRGRFTRNCFLDNSIVSITAKSKGC